LTELLPWPVNDLTLVYASKRVLLWTKMSFCAIIVIVPILLRNE
jgi:hypothetical protein